MRLWKRLLLAAVLVIAVCYGWLLIQFLQLYVLKTKNSEVLQTVTQAASETEEDADSQVITINMDRGNPESDEPGSLYLEGDQLRMPAEWLNDYFDCDVYVRQPGLVRISGAGGEAEPLRPLLCAGKGRPDGVDRAQSVLRGLFARPDV